MKKNFTFRSFPFIPFVFILSFFSAALNAADSGAVLQEISANFDGGSNAAPVLPVAAPAVPEASGPAAVTPPAAPAQDVPLAASSWDGYFQQLGTMVRKGSLTDAGINKLDLLVDGGEVMNSAAWDIGNAKKFIHIEVFQWQMNEIGYMFRDLLAEKVKAGVHVRVILDSVGSSLVMPWSSGHKFVDSMRKAGLEVKIRHFQLLHLDHRKVMVMDDGGDGLVAYSGGMNIGDDYQRNWHDQQTRVSGPAIEKLHQSFLNDWKRVAGEELSGFPEPQPVAGGARTYVITHVGGDFDRNIKKAYLLAINTARSTIRIENPYFTDKDVIKALINAATDPRRPGLKVQLIVPLHDDEVKTLKAFRSHYPDMLKAGIEVYEYQPRMEHMKVAVMDHLWATTGSSNLDAESLKYNDEMNLLVFDPAFAADLDKRVFDADILQSVRITGYKPSLSDEIDAHIPFLAPPGPVPVEELDM